MSHKIDYQSYFADLIKLYHVDGPQYIVKMLFESLYVGIKKKEPSDPKFLQLLKKKYSTERTSLIFQDSNKQILHILMFMKLFNENLIQPQSSDEVNETQDCLDLLFIKKLFEQQSNLLDQKIVFFQNEIFILNSQLISALYEYYPLLVDYLKTFYLTEAVLKKEDNFSQHFQQFHQRLISSIPFLPKALKNKTLQNKVVPD